MAKSAKFGAHTPPSNFSESHRRSLVKGASWRVLGSIDTFLLSWLITGNVKMAGTISAIEVFTKIFLFYGHERLWGLIQWGRK